MTVPDPPVDLIGPGPLCSIPDVQDRLGRVLTPAELERAPGMIAEASVLVEAYLGCPLDAWVGPDEDGDDVPDTVPAAVRIITSRMVARVLSVPTVATAGEVSQQTVGPFSTTFAAGTTSGAPWLSGMDQVALKPYRCAAAGFSVMTLEGEQDTGATDWWWGDLEPGERPVVWVDDLHQWWIVGAPRAWREPGTTPGMWSQP